MDNNHWFVLLATLLLLLQFSMTLVYMFSHRVGKFTTVMQIQLSRLIFNQISIDNSTKTKLFSQVSTISTQFFGTQPY